VTKQADKHKNYISSLPPSEVRGLWIPFIHQLQDDICSALEQADGKANFIEDVWQREEGGGGKTRVITNGDVFEKGGVNTSVVFGDVTDVMRKQLKIEGDKWFACGLSLVIHPINPFVPTVHANYRMFELYNHPASSKIPPLGGGGASDRYFGGGTDLTPYYLIEEDAKHFHQTYKDVCDQFDPSFYYTFKKECDDYFENTHRGNERRGIGGIFYDYKKELPEGSILSPPLEDGGAFWMNFGKACGNAFIDAYLPIVTKRKHTPFNEHNKHWQEIRRGRYVEFNLLHDRGTVFGLKTNGRTESILMSLPPTVRFEYNYQPLPGSEEDKLLQVCLHPKDWI
jgi:coproporphyrinogen III oxidase